MNMNKLSRRSTLSKYFLFAVLSLAFFLETSYSHDIQKSRNRLYGYIDCTGEFSIAPIYTYAKDFSEGLAFVRNTNGDYYIDKTGKIVIDIDLQGYWEIPGNFSDGLAKVAIGDWYDDLDDEGNVISKNYCRKIGYINKEGKNELEPIFLSANDFSEGLACVRLMNGCVVIDKKGNIVISSKTKTYAFDCFLNRSFYSEGLLAVTIKREWLYDKKKKRYYGIVYWGFVDREGKIVIEGNFNMVSKFHEGLSRVNKGIISVRGFEEFYGGKWGYIDKKGRVVIKLKYDMAWSFTNGLAAVYKKKKGWGYINKKGKIKIKMKYKSAYPFSEDLAIVEINQKYGYIDKRGKLVIKPIFDKAKQFKEGFAPVEINGKWGYIDKKGCFLVKPKFEKAFSFSDGLARVKVFVARQ